ncbi:MAG: NirD/YgiW/YdeI family stress tolerance protein [Candidatus Omnitrophica bacterium]|nr:NirD/YgiW/YdeI family stress tolerance protein [Candidatus Omnitrophota bacterium]MCA9431539.1 NirD/YgiW/YdeI family stress tolerance protein [Candidatus Omnitrophota bacterium]MCA9434487.1 NirD/YgiW/YdeI family stress tolerance protein [Candidatus Omnitrophota bacterium]MCA9446045.1 NirD/YgiW/YdeI family stress tolerance protein [Candidatus Omnitrophota bacterium]
MKTFTLLLLILALNFSSDLSYAQSVDPAVVPIRTINQMKRDNTPATIEGRIVRQVKQDEFILQDNTGSILVDVEREIHFGIRVGQRIRTSGILDINLFGSREFKARNITILEDVKDLPTSDPSTRPDVRYISNVYMTGKDGEIVTVAGQIVRRLDSREIIIRDESGGEIIVDAEYSRFGNMPLNVGQKIVVTGELDIYWGGPWLEIEAHQIEMAVKEIVRKEAPVQLTVIPISDVLINANDGDFVTITATILQRVDQDDFLFQDDTGTITVDADPRRFSHHGLAEGRVYTVTGRVHVDLDGSKEILALIITAQRVQMVEEKTDVLIMEPEIPIASVYYEKSDGDPVTVAGSIIRQVEPNDFFLQDDTGSIVINVPEGKFEKLDLTIGRFVIVKGLVDSVNGTVNEIDATDISVRKRPGE